MDDGFQNPTLKKDVSFLVFNGELGIGNGKIIPAGPMREKLEDGLNRSDAVIFIGKDKFGLLKKINKPIFQVEIKEQKPKHTHQNVVAFAGIGYPQKFYNSLEKCGLKVAKSYDFPDHHFYTKDELKEVIKKANRRNMPVYTTLKDFVKIPKNLQKSFNVLNIKADFENKPDLLCFMEKKNVL